MFAKFADFVMLFNLATVTDHVKKICVATPGDCHYVAAVLGFHDECRLVQCSQSDSLSSEQSFKYLTVLGKKQITVLCNRCSDIAAFIALVMFCFPAAARHL